MRLEILFILFYVIIIVYLKTYNIRNFVKVNIIYKIKKL